eukprot:Em0003g1438a
MHVLVLTIGALGLIAAASVEFTEEWKNWKLHHGKTYESEKTEEERKAIWLANKLYIDEHNANAFELGYTLSMNAFGDLTAEEFIDIYLTSNQRNNHTKRRGKIFKAHRRFKYPASVDWRTRGAVNTVKNQGQCSASYAFAAVAVLEGINSLANDQMISLSEQNIIDCSVPFGNRGCNGGDVYSALNYIIDNGGVDTENSYGFKEKQSICAYTSKNSGASATGVVEIQSGNEYDLQAAVASVGPVAVSVDANTYAFRFYQKGVFRSTACSSYDLNHSMVVVGYGVYNGKDYWLCKNSWGSNWGINGYILMARNRYNLCGIASEALYPTL